MKPSQASVSTPRALAAEQSAFRQRVEREIKLLLADLQEGDGEAVLDPVRAFLEEILQRALTPPTASEDIDASLALQMVTDPGVARTCFQSVQRLRRTLVSSALAYMTGAGDTAGEIERAFGALSWAEGKLLDHWFSTDSLRRTELLAEVFHDFRSPLTSVFFLSDALYAGLSGSLTETQREQIRLIFAASVSMLTLVDNVLSSQNLEAGKLKAERTPFSIGAIAQEVERITGLLAEQNGLSLRFELQCRGVRVGDPDVVRRILLNLVTNAISYTEEGGVTVRFQDAEAVVPLHERVTVSGVVAFPALESPGGDDLVILVEDTGPGIDAKQQEELFTAFRPSAAAQRSGERRFSGAGLGLSICHRLARLAGGEIWVESELGQGTAFGVRLPFPPLEGSS